MKQTIEFQNRCNEFFEHGDTIGDRVANKNCAKQVENLLAHLDSPQTFKFNFSHVSNKLKDCFLTFVTNMSSHDNYFIKKFCNIIEVNKHNLETNDIGTVLEILAYWITDENIIETRLFSDLLHSLNDFPSIHCNVAKAYLQLAGFNANVYGYGMVSSSYEEPNQRFMRGVQKEFEKLIGLKLGGDADAIERFLYDVDHCTVNGVKITSMVKFCNFIINDADESLSFLTDSSNLQYITTESEESAYPSELIGSNTYGD